MITLIANPSSRSGRGKRLWPLWCDMLQRSALPFDICTSTSREDCEKKARNAVIAQDAPVTAVGGDGTINAVISGVMSEAPDVPAEKRIHLGVLYAGTSPDFCRFHAIPTEPEAAMRTLLAGVSRLIDITAVSFACPVVDKADESVAMEGFFASSCNIGLGAATAAFANTFRTFFGDTIGTGLGLAKAMLTHRPFDCRLMIDGEPKTFAGVNHVIILKNPHIASGLRVNLPALPDDGFLHAVVIYGHTRLGLLGLMRALYRGGWSERPGIFVRQCRGIAVETTPVQEVEYDGDPRGRTPVHATLLPKALPVVCDISRGEGSARN